MKQHAVPAVSAALVLLLVYPGGLFVSAFGIDQTVLLRSNTCQSLPALQATVNDGGAKEPSRRKRKEEIIERFQLTPNKYDLFWLDRYIDLEHYKKVYGDCLVPKIHPANQRLGTWVSNQRTHYRYLVQKDNPHREETKKESNIKEWRIQLFEEIGFEWKVTGWEDVWEQRFEDLMKYKDEHGDCDVPTEYKKNRKLGIWVNTQRKQYRLLQEGKESDMTNARIKKLEKIGFQWYINGPRVPWDERFEQLKEFKNRFKHCNVPMNWKENRELSLWVMNQRAQYRLMKEGIESQISDESVELLESIGFEWTVQVPWEKRFEELKEFKRRFNHCNVPRGWEENRDLGLWVNNQRAQYRLMQEGKESSMTEERIELLESVGFQWSLRPKRK